MSGLTLPRFEQSLRKSAEPNFTIHLQKFTWRVHADVLTRNSDFFKNLCKTNAWKESKDLEITLHDDNPFGFARLLQFVYYGHYLYDADDTREDYWGNRELISIVDLMSGARHDSNDVDQKQDQSLTKLSRDLEVYELADKYGMSGLKAYALRRCVSNYQCGSSLSSSFLAYYPDRMNQDPELKKVVAICMASSISEIRLHQHEWENGAGKWMKEDFELCTMVIDKLILIQASHPGWNTV